MLRVTPLEKANAKSSNAYGSRQGKKERESCRWEQRKIFVHVESIDSTPPSSRNFRLADLGGLATKENTAA